MLIGSFEVISKRTEVLLISGEFAVFEWNNEVLRKKR